MTISDELKADWTGPDYNEVLVSLVEISHPSWAAPYRLAMHNTDVVHNSQTYTAWSFKLNLPSENQGAIPRDALSLDNVSSEIAASLKSVAGSRTPPTVVRKVIPLSNPNWIERGPTTYTIRKAKSDYFQILADLVLNGFETDAIPRHKIDPTNAPGAFGRIA